MIATKHCEYSKKHCIFSMFERVTRVNLILYELDLNFFLCHTHKKGKQETGL